VAQSLDQFHKFHADVKTAMIGSNGDSHGRDEGFEVRG